VRALIGAQLGPPSDVAPAVTTPDLSAGGTRSSGTAPTGDWSQVILAGDRPQSVDGILFDATPPSATLVIQASKDGGRTWTVVYDDQAPGGTGGQRWLTFPPVTATGLRVIVGATQAPPAFGAYLR